MEINLEEDATQPTSDESLLQISTMCGYVNDLDIKINELSDQLSSLSEHRRKLVELDIPEAMRASGVELFKLKNGRSVELKKFIVPSYAKENAHEVFKWLRENGNESLIKNIVEVQFGKGEDEKASKLCELLSEMQYQDWSQKESVHPSTFKAFIKEQMELGTALPKEISIFEKTEAIIKEAKNVKSTAKF